VAVRLLRSRPAHAGFLFAKLDPMQSERVQWDQVADLIWESGTKELNELMAKRGDEGFELVTIGPRHAFFKRPRVGGAVASAVVAPVLDGNPLSDLPARPFFGASDARPKDVSRNNPGKGPRRG
jgi:hypothetical protein